MNWLAALRHHQGRAARLATAVFAVSWLAFAVAPCQAMSVMPEEPPHHGSMPMDDCGHCPPATDTAPECADAAPADCLSSAQPAIELRQLEQPKLLAIPPLMGGVFATLAPAAGPPPAPAARAAPLPHASLQQRYCSYLK